MTTRYLLREQRGNIITPRPDKGLFFGPAFSESSG